LVICPAKLQTALKTWVEYRTGQGHQIKVIEPAKTPYEIRIAIKKEAKSGKLKNLVLIGDCRVDRDHKNKNATVPTDYVKAKVNVLYGAVPNIATDNRFADLNGDNAPDLAVGRLPVDTANELTTIINKIISYEKSVALLKPEQNLTGQQIWRRKINIIAGVGGFGALQDKIVENATKKLITDLVPADYETTMTYASCTSPFCPDPNRFSETTMRRMNEGCLFWVYVGHGHHRTLDHVNLPLKQYKIFDVHQCDQVKCAAGMPIAIFLACHTCGFDNHDDCIGEQLIKQPQGPIAVLGGSRVTMPYGMAVMSLEMIDDYFHGNCNTLGELIRRAKSRLVLDNGRKGEYRQMLDTLGKAFSPTGNMLEQERTEHSHLIHLLGDPLLRLARPEKIKVQTEPTALSGAKARIEIDAPFDGQAQVELVYRRNRLTFRPKPRDQYLYSDEQLKEFQKVYEQANDRVRARKSVPLKKGPQSIELDIPQDARGQCNVRVFMASEKSFAAGGNPIRIIKSKK
jgi:hypothetical protein